MNADEIELILFDLHGTLLDSDQQLRPASLAVLRTLMQGGVSVGLTSGGTLGSIRALLDEIAPNGPLILQNGCALWEMAAGAPLAQHTMQRDRAVEFVRVMSDLRLPAFVYIREELFTNSPDAPEGVEVSDLVTLVRDHELAPTRLACLHHPQDVEVVCDALRAVHEECSLVRPAPDRLEVLPTGVNKGAMLEEIEHHYRINPRHVLAFGNELDDVELLRRAGRAVVMSSGNPAMRTLVPDADFIGGNDSEAIADFLTKLYGLPA